MGPEHENGMAFPEVIDINSLAVAMDSIYNRGTEIATVIKSIRLKEKNGLDIRNLSGRVKMGESGNDITVGPWKRRIVIFLYRQKWEVACPV